MVGVGVGCDGYVVDLWLFSSMFFRVVVGCCWLWLDVVVLVDMSFPHYLFSFPQFNDSFPQV